MNYHDRNGSVTMQIAYIRFVVPLILLSQAMLVSAKSQDMELYIKFHISLDRAYDGQQQASSLSNNSSRFGFQGFHKTKTGYKFVWRIENKVYIDESGGRLGNPVYAGFEGKAGQLLAGFIDTPYKSFVSKFNIMDDTVADVRSILGYNGLGSDAVGSLNVRARNALLYENKIGAYFISLLFSAENGDKGTTTGLDDNANGGYSARFEYEQANFNIGMAAEKWKGAKQLQGIRIGGRYRHKSILGGVVIERVDSSPDPRYRHDAYAIDVGYINSNNNQVKLQFISATPDKSLPDSGARMLSLGDYYRVDKELSYYVIATKLINNSNAKYQLGTSGHGDIINPAYGGDIWALSFGVVFRIATQL